MPALKPLRSNALEGAYPESNSPPVPMDSLHFVHGGSSYSGRPAVFAPSRTSPSGVRLTLGPIACSIVKRVEMCCPNEPRP